MIKTKADLSFHYDARGPVVNVKVRDSWYDGYAAFTKGNPDLDPEFTREWIDKHISEDYMQAVWEHAIENGWENLQTYAEEIYGDHVKVWSCGRQGGYAYIEGINTDTESWDAIELGRWRKFAKMARAEADDIMYQVVDLIYSNKFEAWKDERSELRAPDIEAYHAVR